MRKYVVGFMFADRTSAFSRRVALITKARPDWQRGRLNGVGGKIEEGETAPRAMVREFFEEAHVATREDDWHNFAVVHGVDWVVYYFRADAQFPFFLTGNCEEPVLFYPIDERGQLTTPIKLPIVEHLSWTIPLALDHDVDYAVVIDRTADGEGRTRPLGAPPRCRARHHKTQKQCSLIVGHPGLHDVEAR